MKSSLLRQLLTTLISTQVLAALIAAAATYTYRQSVMLGEVDGLFVNPQLANKPSIHAQWPTNALAWRSRSAGNEESRDGAHDLRPLPDFATPGQWGAQAQSVTDISAPIETAAQPLWQNPDLMRALLQPAQNLDDLINKAQKLTTALYDNPLPLVTHLLPALALLMLIATLSSRFMRRQLGEAVESGNDANSKARFIAVAAHELRSPLTALSLDVQNLKNAADSPTAVREQLPRLEADIMRTRRLAEQLLTLARTEALVEMAQTVDVSVFARELIARAMPVALQRGIDLGLDEAAHFNLRCAAETLRLVIGNALDNALKYVDKEGVVTLRLALDGDAPIIEVIDNGPGIPAEERKHVFEPFYRATKSAEGSGLGLAIAHEAAKRLGGCLTLLAPPQGSGLVFRYRATEDMMV